MARRSASRNAEQQSRTSTRRAGSAPVRFPAAFAASGRKCLQADADGEVTLTLIVPESHAAVALAMWAQLRDRPFTLEVGPETEEIPR